ncbi:cation-translocating P-type ATPase [Flavobacterium arcticum]|uniref:Cation-translocating P-type ATPase n=1 Tax=Flavobacterium arcticum TaxID=1784713 RepID=A0A345H8A5_9FLAO|nr:cation-translocating P-type ATPase [Flavobacterium arcticum]AXG72815.1 cation-translocating P-type ATPase [Flavobacterium arcticum]KAF2510520.1 cation-translocating P-type ATPase [Flavobacterium arcticum]
MAHSNFGIKGLTDAEVLESREQHGSNAITYKKEYWFFDAVKSLFTEPMVLLLLVAAIIYFISGDTGDSIFMLFAILLVATISLYQDRRSRNALRDLKNYTQPHCSVIRNGEIISIENEELVIGDFMVTEEGSYIPADGNIVHSNDFSVNESVITGEAMSVSKNERENNNSIFQGTIVTGGLAIAKVTAIGSSTKLGKIGESLDSIKEEKTPLEIQIAHFVKIMVIIGAIVFTAVWGIHFYQSGKAVESLLKALTLAMSILPEEIPVAFTAFMALGAWRLMQKGILVKQMKTVETLGSATVICTDKTGTITQNKMALAELYVFADDAIINADSITNQESGQLLTTAMWASEPIPFDPMEAALHAAYKKMAHHDERPEYTMMHEYPLDGKPPMMTHLFENKSGNRIIAAKGAPEALIDVSGLNEANKNKVKDAITTMASKGYRVLGVGSAQFDGNNFLEKQQDYNFTFLGLVAFYDPPKDNIKSVFEDFYKAGIAIKIVTGDNEATTTAIAKQVDFRGSENHISGDELMALDDTTLQQKVMDTAIFTRMFPEAKLRIINALKAQGQIVAMTGDGVNDGPALKAAHIGIAMGNKGTEIAKEAASLILPDDDLVKMVDAIAMGRRIYANLKKAIQYIISIHIPIILTVFIPVALGWKYPDIFSPVHIIFLELIMGPTCSVIYENEPMEKNAMSQKPRPFTNTFFSFKEIITSIIQGIAITVGTLGVYLYAVNCDYNEAQTRTMVFTVLVSANIFLTLVNRSFYYSVITTLRYKNNFIPLIIGITVILTMLLLYIEPIKQFFNFETLTIPQMAISIASGFITVVWFEVVKWMNRKRNPLA